MREITILLLYCGLMLCSACNKAEHSYKKGKLPATKVGRQYYISSYDAREIKRKQSQY